MSAEKKSEEGTEAEQAEPRAFSYLRVSTDGQNTEKNKNQVRAYANEKGFP